MDLIQSIRLTVRSLLKERGYAFTAIVTLALAIGANTAIFSAVHAILLRPLPIRDPGHLVVFWGAERSQARSAVIELTYNNFRDWAAHTRSFTHLAAMGSTTWPAVLEGRGEPTRLASAGVSVSFFETLGVPPLLGRAFTPEDDGQNAARVVILSHRAWTQHFGADPGVIGTTMELDTPHTVVGVMPEGFDFPRGVDVWLPVVPILARSGDQWKDDALANVGVLFIVGRLREGVTPQLAAEELDRVMQEVKATGATQFFGDHVVVTPFVEYLFGPARLALWALLGAVGVLLLIGCANVSGLLLTRVSLKRRQDAIRGALGATSAALGKHWILEILILAFAGGAVGLLAAGWLVKVIIALAPEDIPRLSDVSVNLPVALFTFIAIVATALICGIEPVRRAWGVNLVEALSDAARGSAGRETHRTRSMLVVLQIALTVVLLVAAGLVVRSFMNLRRIDLGFAPSNVLTMNVQPRSTGLSDNEWLQELITRVTALPDVDAAGAVALRPLALGPIGQGTWVILEGQVDTRDNRLRSPILNYQSATPGYFETMRIALKTGRLFTEQDRTQSTRVALVSESTARQLWPGEDPVGKRMLMPSFVPGDRVSMWRTVVGVVSNVRYRGIDEVQLDVYDPAPQAAIGVNDLVVRTSGNPLNLAVAIQAEARRLDSRVIIDGITTMDAVVSRAVAPWRFSVWMFTLFAILAFALATIGLFSLVSLDVAHRHHEFAVRVALGAQRQDLVRSVLLPAGGRVVTGVTLGVLAAVVGTRAIQGILFDVQVLDLVTYALVLALIFCVVTVATYLPARRAAGVDPLALLRRD